MRIFYANQLLETSDYLYNFTDFGIWSTVEIGLALSASSLGTLRPLLRKLSILSDTQTLVVKTHFSHISNPSGSYGRGGYVARLEAKTTSITAGVDDGAAGSYLPNVNMRDTPDSHSIGLGGFMESRDVEESSESDLDLVIQRT